MEIKVDTGTVRIETNRLVLRGFREDDLAVAHATRDRVSRTTGRGPVTTHTNGLVEDTELDREVAGFLDAVVVLRIRDGAHDRLLDDLRRLLGRELDDLQRVRGLEALASAAQGTALEGRHARIAGDSDDFHCLYPLTSSRPWPRSCRAT